VSASSSANANPHEVKLIAEGRASEIFDLGDGRVLRRFKRGGNPEREALVMRHALERGFAVPRVLEVKADALVLERIEGPTMLQELLRSPTSVHEHASLLAQLHERLHDIEAPAGLEAVVPGTRLVHLDLHPENVILSPSGPVVVDWTNAGRGDPAFDVAVTWVIGETSTGGGHLVRSFLEAFLAHFDRRELLRALPAAAQWRREDANVTSEERRAIDALLRRGGLTQ
jgi:aminoglycoside phosphotransferase (APT) family kinase protein